MKARTVILAISVATVAATSLAVTATAAPPTRVTTDISLAITSRTLLDESSADGNVFVDRELCGTGSLANGGSQTWCEHLLLILHPNGNWTFHGTGTIDGSYPECGNVTSDFEINGSGLTNGGLIGATALLFGDFRVGSIGESASDLHILETGDLTPGISGATIRYSC